MTEAREVEVQIDEAECSTCDARWLARGLDVELVRACLRGMLRDARAVVLPERRGRVERTVVCGQCLDELRALLDVLP